MKKILLFFGLCITLSLACNLPQRVQPTPSSVSTPSTSLEDQLAQALDELATTGKVTLTITEDQIATFVRQQSSTSENNLQNLQVDFQENRIRLTGTTSTGIMNSQVEVIFEPYISADALQMQVVSAKIGSLPLPEKTVNAISQVVNERIQQLTTIQGKPLNIEEVRVEDGQLSITGSLQ